MKKLFKGFAVAAVLSVSAGTALNAHANTDALDKILEQVKQERISEGKINKQREQEFLSERADKQALLNKAKSILKKNGTIIYMVCSFLNLETISQIQNFLEKNPNFYINKFIFNDNEEKLIDNNGFINITPKKYKNINIDGFFAARLTRND
mgnify:CR=1 FL=1